MEPRHCLDYRDWFDQIERDECRQWRACSRYDLDGFRRGQKAAWLPGQDWESMLVLPLEEVRRRLNLESPRVYREMRSTAIKPMVANAA